MVMRYNFWPERKKHSASQTVSNHLDSPNIHSMQKSLKLYNARTKWCTFWKLAAGFGGTMPECLRISSTYVHVNRTTENK